MWMHASLFAVAISFRWQTLTVSANVFAHLENVCVKMESETIAHLHCAVGNTMRAECTTCGKHRSQVSEVEKQHFPSSRWSLERLTEWSGDNTLRCASILLFLWKHPGLRNSAVNSVRGLSPLMGPGECCGLCSIYSSQSVGVKKYEASKWVTPHLQASPQQFRLAGSLGVGL